MMRTLVHIPPFLLFLLTVPSSSQSLPPIPVCPPGYCLQRHTSDPSRGDTCHHCGEGGSGGGSGGGGGVEAWGRAWTCPFTCVRAAAARAPFCVVTVKSGIPCRVKWGTGGGGQSKQHQHQHQHQQNQQNQHLKYLPQGQQPKQWDQCNAALESVRSGEFLRMSPCSPKRAFFDQDLVPLSEEALDHEALGTTPKIGIQNVRFFLHEGIDRSPSASSSSSSSYSSSSAASELLPMLPGSLVDCFFDRLGGVAGFDDLDDRLNPRAAQGMADYWILQRMRQHPARVGARFYRDHDHRPKVSLAISSSSSSSSSDKDSHPSAAAPKWKKQPQGQSNHANEEDEPIGHANVHIIGYPVYTSYLIGTLGSMIKRGSGGSSNKQRRPQRKEQSSSSSDLSQCSPGNGMLGHYDRMSRLAAALEASSLFRRRNGRDFVLVLAVGIAEWDKVLGPRLKEVLSKGPVTLLTSDREYHPIDPKHLPNDDVRRVVGSGRASGFAAASARRAAGGGGVTKVLAESARLMKGAVVVPVKAHHLLDRAANQRPNGFASNRTNSFHFLGSVHASGLTGKQRKQAAEAAVAEERSRGFLNELKEYKTPEEKQREQEQDGSSDGGGDTGFDFSGSRDGSDPKDPFLSRTEASRRSAVVFDRRNSPVRDDESSATEESLASLSSGSIMNEGWARASALLPLPHLFPSANVHAVDVGWFGDSGGGGGGDSKRLSRMSVQGMLRGRFCVIPAGERGALGQRRLFDALGAGCTPVVLGHFEAVAASLPLRSTVKWSELAIFGGGLSCFASHLRALGAAQEEEGGKQELAALEDAKQHNQRRKQTKRQAKRTSSLLAASASSTPSYSSSSLSFQWLQGLLADDVAGEKRLSCIRRRGQIAFAKHLSFRKGGGLISAILTELDETGKLFPPDVMTPAFPLRSQSSLHNKQKFMFGAATGAGHHGSPISSLSSSSPSSSSSREASPALSARLLEFEGFTVRGDFAEWQDDSRLYLKPLPSLAILPTTSSSTDEDTVPPPLMSIRHHSALPSPLAFCAIAGNGDEGWRRLLRLLVDSDRHGSGKLSYVGVGLPVGGTQKGKGSMGKPLYDWADIALVFGSHTSPPFYKATVVRDPITRLLSVFLDRCSFGNAEQINRNGDGGSIVGREWSLCHPPTRDRPDGWNETVSDEDKKDEGAGSTDNKNGSDSDGLSKLRRRLLRFLDRLEASATSAARFAAAYPSSSTSSSPFQHPLLRLQVDSCGLKYAAYDAVARFERFVADSRQVLAKTGALRHAKVATVPPSEGEDDGRQSRSRKMKKDSEAMTIAQWWEGGKGGKGGSGSGGVANRIHKRGKEMEEAVCQLTDKQSRARIERLYRRDFEFLGYNTAAWDRQCANKHDDAAKGGGFNDKGKDRESGADEARDDGGSAYDDRVYGSGSGSGSGFVAEEKGSGGLFGWGAGPFVALVSAVLGVGILSLFLLSRSSLRAVRLREGG